MNEKIRSEHMERTAYVYVRQSTRSQVRNHKESQRLQYGLADRARELGFTKVVTIDDDLGRSGSGNQERPGFARLLTAVCDGSAGAVFALEASRLARNSRDWHHLVDLCALTETLLVDADGVYDPRQLNDRLLLGLKGSMSEFELGLLRQRAREAFEQKVRRGYALWELPVGFVRTEEYLIEKTPNRQVQEAVSLVFKKFMEFGSARQVVLWCHEEEIRLPVVKPGTGGREVLWQLPTSGRVRQMIRNPCYAGAFAYGRTAPNTVIHEGRARSTSRCKKPIEQWKVLLIDHHSGYISWQEYLGNLSILEKNVARGGGETSSGAAKAGSALLSGLLRCGRCGRKLHVGYSGKNGRLPRYVCNGGRVDRGSSSCLSVGGVRLDPVVVETVLAAIQPAGVEAAISAADRLTRQDDERRKALELALQQARYEADRARRQFDAVEPENRLVAAELEARWNVTLEKVGELEGRVEALGESEPVSDEEKARLQELGADLRRAWAHDAAPVELKKRILRTVLHEIIIDSTKNPPEHHLKLHWQGGVHTELRVPRKRPGQHGKTVSREVVDLIVDLAKVCDDKKIAWILNRLGYRTGHGLTWRAHRVAAVRNYRRIPIFQENEEWLTLEQTARQLGVSNTVVRRLIREKVLPAKQVVTCAPWVISRGDLHLTEVQRQVDAVKQGHKLSRTAPGQRELPIF